MIYIERVFYYGGKVIIYRCDPGRCLRRWYRYRAMESPGWGVIPKAGWPMLCEDLGEAVRNGCSKDGRSIASRSTYHLITKEEAVMRLFQPETYLL